MITSRKESGTNKYEKLFRIQLCVKSKENSNDREGQPLIVHVYTNIILIGPQKAFDVSLNSNYRFSLYKTLIYEYRGSRCLHDDSNACTLAVPLCHLKICGYCTYLIFNLKLPVFLIDFGVNVSCV